LHKCMIGYGAEIPYVFGFLCFDINQLSLSQL
jgi:hypothetical protein